MTADSAQTRQLAKNEQDKRDIELFVAVTYRLNYIEYEYFLDYENIEYGFRMDGPFNPREGHRFNKKIMLLQSRILILINKNIIIT